MKTINLKGNDLSFTIIDIQGNEVLSIKSKIAISLQIDSELVVVNNQPTTNKPETIESVLEKYKHLDEPLDEIYLDRDVSNALSYEGCYYIHIKYIRSCIEYLKNKGLKYELYNGDTSNRPYYYPDQNIKSVILVDNTYLTFVDNNNHDQ
jgi:hypothetical protein